MKLELVPISLRHLVQVLHGFRGRWWLQHDINMLDPLYAIMQEFSSLFGIVIMHGLASFKCKKSKAIMKYMIIN